MRLEDMLKDVSGITQNIVKSYCFDGQDTLLDSVLLIQEKVNEVIQAINNGIIKGDKGDKGDTGETGEKGDKGDTGKASESINDGLTDLDHTWSSKKIDSLFNDVKEIDGVKYSTDSSYKVCSGTKNGVVKDLKIYGKTIKGILGSDAKTSYTLNTINRSKMFNLIEPIPANTDIYIRVNVTSKKAPLDGLKINVLNEDDTVSYFDGFKGVFEQSLKINHTKTIKKIGFYLSSAEFTNDDTSNITFKESQVTLVDVGKTYIEGLASVGNGNEIEVSTRKEDGNLLKTIKDGEKTGISNFNIVNDYSFAYTSNAWGQGIRIKVGNIIKGETYVVLVDSSTSGSIDGSGALTTGDKLLSAYNNRIEIVASSSGDGYIRFKNGVQSGNVSFENIRIVKKGSNESFSVYKEDKKTILFKDTDSTWKPILNLHGIDLINCDTIDSVNNKYSVKVKEITNLKDLRWSKEGTFENKDTYFYKLEDGLKVTNITQYGVDCACDKLKCVSVNYITGAMHNVVDCVAYDIRYQVVRISVPKYTNLVDYLTNLNPVLIYPLHVPLEYEINPIYPDSYDNETMISFNTGVINSKKEWFIDSNLGSLVLENINRIERLENEVFTVNKALLRGDLRTVAEIYYPNDFIKKEVLPNE